MEGEDEDLSQGEDKRAVWELTLIPFKALVDVLDEDVLIVDVRKHMEVINLGKISGAVHIPVYDLRYAFGLDDLNFERRYCKKRPTKNGQGTIILYCYCGPRAMAAARMLRAMGYSNFQVYHGGMKDWIAKGGKVEKCEPRDLHFCGFQLTNDLCCRQIKQQVTYLGYPYR